MRAKVLSLLLGASLGLSAGMCHINSAYQHREPSRSARPIVIVQTTIVEKEEARPEYDIPIGYEYEDPDIPDEVEEAAYKYGSEYNICPEFLEAMAFYESSYRTTAENGTCKGLMQINISAQYERMDQLGIMESDLWDIDCNMKVAADYLSELFERYDDPGTVLHLYNGDSRVWEFEKSGDLSDYASNILTMSWELEEKHGKEDLNKTSCTMRGTQYSSDD